MTLSDTAPTTILLAKELPELGALPANAYLPYLRNKDFVGREAELSQVATILGQGISASRLPVVAITGMGGVGKTQTAVEFCYRYGRFFAGGVFWMSFAKAENVAEEVAVVGSERGLGLFEEKDQLSVTDQVRRVQRAWQESIPRLLVFDNCEDETLLAKWLPVTGGCHVLLTSRRGVWAQELGVTAVALTPLTHPESSLLLKHLAPRLEPTEAAEIAAEIGHLPLALHLAGSFLRRYHQITSGEYIKQLRNKGLLSHPSLAWTGGEPFTNQA